MDAIQDNYLTNVRHSSMNFSIYIGYSIPAVTLRRTGKLLVRTLPKKMVPKKIATYLDLSKAPKIAYRATVCDFLPKQNLIF